MQAGCRDRDNLTDFNNGLYLFLILPCTVWTVNNIFVQLFFQALAQIWGCAFVEASAKHRTNVNEVFAEIVREMNLKHSTKDREIVCECCCIS